MIKLLGKLKSTKLNIEFASLMPAQQWPLAEQLNGDEQ